jgi:hypothetical protein
MIAAESVESIRRRALCLGAVGAYGELEDAYCEANVATLNELTSSPVAN